MSDKATTDKALTDKELRMARYAHKEGLAGEFDGTIDADMLNQDDWDTPQAITPEQSSAPSTAASALYSEPYRPLYARVGLPQPPYHAVRDERLTQVEVIVRVRRS